MLIWVTLAMELYQDSRRRDRLPSDKLAAITKSTLDSCPGFSLGLLVSTYDLIQLTILYTKVPPGFSSLDSSQRISAFFSSPETSTMAFTSAALHMPKSFSLR